MWCNRYEYVFKNMNEYVDSFKKIVFDDFSTEVWEKGYLLKNGFKKCSDLGAALAAAR